MTAVPNTFQTFNFYVDRAMELLTDSELRVLLYATRHIMGWQDRVEKRTGAISLTMFENGFTTKDGQHYGGCGLGRHAIAKAVDALVNFGFLERDGEPTADGQAYRIPTGKIEWQKLEDRKQETTDKAKKQTSNATAKRLEGGSSNDTSTSNDTSGGSSNDTMQGDVGRTESNTSSNPSSKTNTPTSKKKGKSEANSRIDTTIAAWLAGQVTPPASNQYGNKGVRTNAAALVAAGFTPDQITAYVKVLTGQAYWQGKLISIKYVADNIAAYYASHKPAPVIPAHQPIELPPEDGTIPPPPEVLAALTELKSKWHMTDEVMYGKRTA